MKAETIEDVLELSPLQQGILFESLQADSSLYVRQLSLTIDYPIVVDAYRRAWQYALDRHAALRTSFYWEEVEQPVQVVQRGLRMRLTSEDFTALNDAERADRVASFLEEDRRRGFDLSRPPLLRVALIRLDVARFQLVISFHHLILDGWSLVVLFTEVASLYEAYCSGRDLQLPTNSHYGSYIAWLQSQDQAAAEAYWRRVLRGYGGAMPLLVDRANGRPSRNRGSSEQQIKLSREDTAALRDLARRAEVTVNTLIQGAWSLLLRCYTGSDDLVFGAVVSGRPAAVDGVESMVGLFINTLPVRVQVDAQERLLPWLKRLHAEQLEAREYGYVPLSRIHGWSGTRRGVSLFDSLVAFENYPVGAYASRDYASVVAQADFVEGTEYPISLSIIPGAELELRLGYIRDRFDSATVNRLLRHLQQLLLDMVAAPEKRLGELEVLTPSETRQLIVEWTNTAAPYPRGKCVHELFEQQVERMPDAVAVVSGDRRLTYREVNEAANRIARYLRNLGVCAESFVGVYLDRGPDLISGILGVLKAGGAYLPLDAGYPAARIKWAMEDARPHAVITTSALQDKVAASGQPIVCLDTEADRIRQESAENLPPNATAGNLANIIYTSGSTGVPKGILIEHRALVNHAIAVTKNYGITADDRVLQFASPAFDVFGEEVFPALLSGATVVLRPDDATESFQEFHAFVDRSRVTVLNLPASFWRQWLSELNVAAGRPPSSVRLLIVGNERVGTDDWEQWVSLAGPSVETRNAYGPTETTITATVFGPSASLPAGTGSVPIGRAIANVQTFILDAMLRPVSIGLPGELYIAGDGLARGYLGRSAETASSFVPHPFVPGARIYRSGDICRYLPDGNLEFLGRFDNQVKIRGYRVELEEVERALGEHPRIRECAAAMHEHDGQTRLAAYVVPRSEPELWPSIGEYFLHDPLMYHAMTHDESRNQAYRTAISRCVKDKVVLDIGTGADAILARFCLEFGARRVYAIEKLESAYVQAERLLAELGIDDRIVLLKGEATDIQLPEKADVCVSELLGMIGSAEGVIGILNDARRFLKDDGVMIPVRCVTKMAAAFLPGELAAQPRFTELSGPYAEKVFDSIGHPFDVRVCIRNFPDDHLVSDAQVFEHLDFNGVVSPMLRSEVLLTITRRARVDGFLLWLNVYTADDVMLDVRREEHNWLPVFFPAFYPGIEVEPGDVIRAVCSVDSNGQTLPGYRITGSIVRSNGSIIPFDYESLHDSDFFRRSPFYQKLFTEDWQENYRPIPQFIPEIRSLLRDRVPEYLIPSSFVTLKTLPRLPNGKVDRRSLPRPNDVGSGPAHSFQLPRNHIEKQLAALWAETLGVDRVGVHDNFFELGGDSIVSIQLVSRARREGIGITVNQLFQHPTVAELARVANVADGTVAGVEAESAQTVISRDVPLTAIQQWFFEQDFVNPDHSNQAVMFEVRQPLNLAIASDAVRVLVSRHDALRLRFAATKEGWRQFYATAETAPGIHLIDLSTVEEHDQKNAIEAEAVRIQASLNLDAGPIFRAAYLDFGRAGSGRLLFVVHHLAVDTVSWRILMEDFWTAYAQLAGQTAVQSASRTASFQTWAERIKDYALRSHALRQELKFWIQLANSPTTPVPVDLPGGANTIESAQTVRVALNPEETAALLLNVPRAYQTHINDVLLTALTQACCRWTGKTQVFLYLEGHGREDILEGLDVSRTVGWFTSLFPVRLDLANIRQPGEALKSIKEQLRRIPNRGIGYGLLRYLSGDARIKEQLSAMPSPEITFNYLGQMGDRDSENVPVVRAMEDVGPLVSMADRRAGLLDINGIVSEGKLQFSWTYSKNIHHHSTIEKVAQDFIRMLQALIEHCLSPQAGGYTPSDFSRARVSQKDLDGLLRDLGSGPGNAS